MKRYHCTCSETNDILCLAHERKMSRSFYKREEDQYQESEEETKNS